MHYVKRSTSPAPPVDNADWVKTIAIISVSIGHIGHFFMADDHWWAVFGRLAAPTFFFLIGYAETRTVPPYWIWLGILLTLLEASNASWSWVALNILLSFALIRMARPYVKSFLQYRGWAAFGLIAFALFAVQPVAAKMVDYGAEGWLWSLFGLCQRIYIENKSAADGKGATQTRPPSAASEDMAVIRVLACVVAMAVYLWQEQMEFSFPPVHFIVFTLSVAIWAIGLCLFTRGPSSIQPSKPLSAVLHFVGRRTLEIYAIQLAASELVIKLLPDLAP